MVLNFQRTAHSTISRRRANRSAITRRVSRLALALMFLLVPTHAFSTNVGGSQISLSKPLVLQWHFGTDDILNLTPAVYKDSVYLPLRSGNLVALSLLDGKIGWKTEVGGNISASPSADRRAVYVAAALGPSPAAPGAGTPSGTLRALGLQSGVTVWMLPLQSPLRGEIYASEDALFGCTEDGRILAVSKDDGRLLWSLKGEQAFTPGQAIGGGLLFTASEDGSIWALDPGTGKVAWRYRTGVKGTLAIAHDGGMLFVGSEDNVVYALSTTGGQLLWRHRTSGSIQSIVPTPRGVLVTSLDNFVYSLSTKRGKRNWKKRLTGRVAAPPAVSLDAALFAPLSGDECVVLDLKSGKKLNAVFVGDDNNTAATPLIAGRTLLLTTRKGLVAFSGTS